MPGNRPEPERRGRWPVVLATLLLVLFVAATSGADLVATVREVIDGDTVVLNNGQKVRYLGVNAPEHGQPYAREATDFNRQLVSSVSVRLEFDKVQQDRYGRLLAYVYQGSIIVNERLLAEG